jgi:hypothetical protein
MPCAQRSPTAIPTEPRLAASQHTRPDRFSLTDAQSADRPGRATPAGRMGGGMYFIAVPALTMSSVGNARRNAGKHIPPATRGRALELLAASRDGATEAILVAHGFTVGQMVELVHAGLATATSERVVAGERKVELVRVRVTEAGRRTRKGAAVSGLNPGGTYGKSVSTSLSPRS